MRVFYVVSTRVIEGGANRSLINLISALKKLDPSFSCSALINYEGSMADALRELIGRVKGDRSMAKFADDIKLESPNTKVSAPTLSRAMNWMPGKAF